MIHISPTSLRFTEHPHGNHVHALYSIQTIAKVGNKKARERYEAMVPPCWLPPKPHSRQYVRLARGSVLQLALLYIDKVAIAIPTE